MTGRCTTLFLAILLLFSCGKKNKLPSGILPPDKMQVVLWDVIRADAFTINFINRDTSKNAEAENIKLQQKIFSLHHVSKEEFYKSYSYYKANTMLMKEMMDSMLLRVEREKNKNIKPLQE